MKNKETKPKKKSSFFWRIIKGSGIVLLLLIVLIQSPLGKKFIAKKLTEILSQSTGQTIVIKHLSGFIPINTKIESISISDVEGPWLVAEKVNVHWDWSSILNRNIHLHKVEANSIKLLKKPILDLPKRTASQEFEIPVTINKIQINTLQLSRAFAGADVTYQVNGELYLNHLRKLTGIIRVSGDLTAKLTLSTSHNEQRYQLTLQEWKHPQIGVKNLRATGSLFIKDHTVQTQLQATSKDWDLRFTSQLKPKDDPWNIQLQKLTLRYKNQVQAQLSGQISPDHLHLQGTLDPFKINQWNATSQLRGQIKSQFSITGSMEKPIIKLGADLLDFRPAEITSESWPQLGLHLDATLQNKTLQARLSSNALISKQELSAQLHLPVELSFSPFHYHANIQKTKATLQSNIKLYRLNAWKPLNGQRIEGTLLTDLTFDASKPASNTFSGTIQLQDGIYEQHQMGVVLHQIQGKIIASPTGLTIQSFHATDGASGQLTLSGSTELFKPTMPLHLQLEINQAQLIRRDEFTSTFSGNLFVTNQLLHPHLSGTIIVDRADILLDKIPPPAPQLLTNYERKTTTNTTEKITAQPTRLTMPIDLLIKMPDRIFFNSALIESIWGGELRLQNSLASGLSVKGKIHPQRGFISFIGKKFRFQNDSWIEFDGKSPPAPSIYLTAEYSRKDIIALLTLSGKLNNPTYTLSSTPALPEDEILAQVLFGRDTSSISAYQAYQIITAARQLSNGPTGPGFMYKVRQSLGVDTLEWREAKDPTAQSSIAAGKYLTPELYIEINSSFEDREGSSSISAEYELNKQFSIETYTGPELRPGIGFNWKKEY